MDNGHYKTRCRLINNLSERDRLLLLPHFQRIILRHGQVIQHYDHPINYVYFIESGISSIVLPDRRLEIAITGSEGFVGVSAILGNDRSPAEAVMKIGGQALRIGVDPLRRAMEESPSLRGLLLRYAEVLMTQTGQAALSYAHSTLLERLARWISMTHDRLQTEEIPLTHEFVAAALGARRASVTSAFHHLEGDHIVQARRGRIRIIDPVGLRARAGAAYGLAEAEYDRLIGPMTSFGYNKK